MPESGFINIGFNAFVLIMYLVFWGAVFVILYHFTRFGVGTQPKRLAAIFLVGAVVLFGLSILFFAELDLKSLIQ